ncbi:spore coat protein [Oceanobacillus bengalensis]|uniref:Spore coat protein n=1 Tax=Oceanobacillus bengalensis TaxID=1435466 RepID=A0A494Z4S3_9BACI|nr:spore coat protein [Oceanobacillus bengalensis]RKQ17540.1 spore coat protein [Oceanobacillus bengalensis]
MDDSSKQQPATEKVIKVMVDNIFRKNGVQPEELKKNISDEQRQMLKEMVQDLRQQVDQFNKAQKKVTDSEE